MKAYIFLTGILCLIMIFSPLCCLGAENQFEKSDNSDLKGSTITVLQTSTGKAIETEIYNYIIGAVAAEMPASFSDEALKAQAVASYTYAVWLRENADNSEKALGYDISDDPSSHQGYLTDEQMKEKWGDKYDSCKNKISEAVMSVSGECVMYENEPILAMFHAISSGQTQSSETVFGNALPYLVSVTAPGDTLSPDFDSENEFSQKELCELLSLESADESLIKSIDTADSGYVRLIVLGSKSYMGNELASLLKLKSPCFSAEYKKGSYIFKVKGYGHGVGMSQYSADYMARQGYTYDEILKHFYKGTYIDKIV